MFSNQFVLLSFAKRRAESISIVQLDRSKSVAVLPFSDYGDASVQWFASGLTDEITTALTRTPDIVTASALAVRRATERGAALEEIAKGLNVAHVLEGSVRRVDNRLRVTVRLVRARDQVSIWSRTFDQDAGDLISIQEQIAVEIAQALETTLDPETLERMVEIGTRSPDAYQAYLRARAIETRSSTDVLVLSADDAYRYLEEARALDPNFAEAHFRAAEYWRDRLSPTENVMAGLERDESARRRQAFRERIADAIAAADDPIERKRYLAAQALFELKLAEGHAYLKAVAEERPLDMFLWRDLAEWSYTLNMRETARRATRRFANLAWDNPYQLQLILEEVVHAGFARLAERLTNRLLELDRDSPAVLYQVHRAILWSGDIPRARQILARIDVEPHEEDLLQMARARQGCAEGDAGPALTLLSETRHPIVKWLLLHLLNRPDEARELLSPYDRTDGHYQLVDLMDYAPFNADAYPALAALLKDQGLQGHPPQTLPYACPAG